MYECPTAVTYPSSSLKMWNNIVLNFSEVKYLLLTTGLPAAIGDCFAKRDYKRK